MALKREVRFEPGYDCIRFECKHGSERCKPGSGGSHGRHGMQIRWLVVGEKGAVQFLLYTTDWGPEPAPFGGRLFERELLGPSPCDLGYHAKEAQYEGQEAMRGNCDVLGGPCYYDGSGLNADEPWRVLCNWGGEALWEYLEGYYGHVFEGKGWPVKREYEWRER
jgi:hypothetical protein